MQFSLDISAAPHGSLQSKIHFAIRDAISRRLLPPDTRLPSSRDLADTLNVSRNTVIGAYAKLSVEGYIVSRHGVGIFVARELPEDCLSTVSTSDHTPAAPIAVAKTPTIEFVGEKPNLFEKGRELPAIDFWAGRSSRRSFPIRTWQRLITQCLGSASRSLVEYPPVAGLPELRQAIAAEILVTRGIICDWQNILVTAGAQEAFTIISKLFIRPGSTAVVESPSYQGVSYILTANGAHLIPTAVEREGISVTEVERIRSASLLCLTPSHQFPTGETISAENRARLLEWAAKAGAYIVEDDYDSEFRYENAPITAIAGMDMGRQQVLYVGTFSKSIGAGLRIGYLVLPDRVVQAASVVKSHLNLGNPWLEQAVLAEFILSGQYRTHLRRLRQEQRRSRDILIASLEEDFGRLDLRGTDAGMHMYWRLPPTFPNVKAISAAARELDIGIYSPAMAGAEEFGRGDNAIVLGYPALSHNEICEGVRRLKTAIESLG